MNKNFCIGVWVVCLGFANVNFSWAGEVMEISPIIVQPGETQAFNQQMLERDRQNRDEEIAIQELIEQNNNLVRATLARQQDEGLAKINQTMLSYRRALLARDQARIAANAQRWGASRYGDLIALTEDVDAMTRGRQVLESKGALLAEKYQMLTQLKNEMAALNDKLAGEDYQKIAHQQQDRIQMLVVRLAEMDQKISRFDEIIAQKDRQIATRDQSLRWLNLVLTAAKNKADYYKLTSQQELAVLNQEQQETAALKKQLEERIAHQQNQYQLQIQIQDLTAQLQDKEHQISSLKARMRSYQETQAQSDTLRQQWLDQQNKLDLLKQELESKIAESQKLTLLIWDYQKKLEAKDLAYNEELRRVLFAKNDRFGMQEQIAAKDLSLSMLQRKITALKTDLALARQQLAGMPSSDEIDFLRTGFDKASAQLKQKDAMIAQAKATADEYEKEFHDQSREFQSVKQQLQNAYEEIHRQNEDLKYKDLAIIRLKERLAISGGGLQEVQALQAQLKSADKQIRDLKAQLNRGKIFSKGDRLQEKLKQALEEVDAQGRVINLLIQKLHDAGQNANLTPYFAK